jgi:hypothetical protein
MPLLNGLEAARRIYSESPETHTDVNCMHGTSTLNSGRDFNIATEAPEEPGRLLFVPLEVELGGDVAQVYVGFVVGVDSTDIAPVENRPFGVSVMPR